MGKSSSTFSSARTPVPAATSPTSGTLRTAEAGSRLVVSGSKWTWMARGLLGSRDRYPSRWRTARWVWTVAEEARPTASPISRTEGG